MKCNCKLEIIELHQAYEKVFRLGYICITKLNMISSLVSTSKP